MQRLHCKLILKYFETFHVDVNRTNNNDRNTKNLKLLTIYRIMISKARIKKNIQVPHSEKTPRTV